MKTCKLSVLSDERDVRKSDSAEYKFRFTTNQPGGKYSGSPGVTLSVTDLQVHVSRLLVYEYYNQAVMTCQSSCLPPGHPHYVWYKNGQNIQEQTSNSYSGYRYFYPKDSVSCAVRGYEDFSSPPVLIQSQREWRVTYTPTEVCAFTGSTVNMRCRYTYPSTTNSAVQNTFWFTKEKDGEPVDLTTDSQYSSRVQHTCDENDCTLTISHLTKRDSAQYKFRFMTNQPDGTYTGSPGVTLSVTDPQLQINVRRSTLNSWTELTCQSQCQLPEDVSYIWYQNGQERNEVKVYFHPHPLNPADNYSCAIKGHEKFSSPSVYGPKLPSMSVSPSAEIVEGSSVTLTCSSDANPAANYTWYKENHTPLSEEPQLVFSSIQSSDSGQYYCRAENQLGRTSKYINVDVKYAPKLPSVSVSPSAEIVEGSSVTLTCSSDANPAANYTWYKENQTRPHGEGAIYSFPSIRSEDRGIYYCKSENKHGEINSTSLVLDVQYAPKLPSVSISAIHQESWTSAVIGTTSAVFLAIIGLSVFLLIRKRRASRQSSESVEGPHNRQQCLPNELVERDDIHYASIHFANQTDPVYSNLRPARLREYEEVEYAAVKFQSASASQRSRETGEDPAALYSTVNKPAEHNRNR
ncbi:hypothetical protein VZT92_003299 [Zoarces viviparus]|uniref:Ig-like domain-containing protein n=1 Tax=Zoarces viviparus TaxID=48416 RepID=A0AAW1G2J6_ZOAVI